MKINEEPRTYIVEIDGEKPVPKGRPRLGKFGNVYTPKQTKAFERLIRKRAAYCFNEPLEGPVRLIVEFHLGPQKSMKKAIIGKPHVSRPDLDNLVKSVKDSLNGVWFKDDSQVFDMRAIKLYGKYKIRIICEGI